ncbi:MAG: hypothetical protein IT340_00750 [Chloroflexi bacterium]|nr:hypothetical protein [Chloroflexota bacterium]
MMRVMMRALTVLMVALLLGPAVIVVPPVEAADIRHIEPTDTEGEYDIEASGFTPGEDVSVRLIGPSEQVIKLDRDRASRRGRVSFRFFMPRYIEPGAWTLRLEGVDSGKKTKDTFVVPERGPNVDLAVTPTTGPVGTTFTITSAAFHPGERISAWVTRPDGESVPIDETRANEAGQVAVTVIVPPGGPVGDWFAAIYGLESDRLGAAAFQVASE